LNFLYSFVLASPEIIFIWQGRFSNEAQQNAARSFAEKIKSNRTITLFNEGEESDEFWSFLQGGKTNNYYGSGEMNLSIMNRKRPEIHPRLYLCSNATGTVKIDEIHNFAQDEQDNPQNHNHLLILDSFYEIYVWIGSYSMPIEKKLGMQAAIEYLEKSTVNHDKDTKVWVTYPFQEPIGFTSQFRGWNNTKFPNEKKNLQVAKIPVQEILKDYVRDTYSYVELQQDPLPPGVNPKKLEIYLSESEFETVFKITRAQFNKLPLWKAERLKQQFNLY